MNTLKGGQAAEPGEAVMDVDSYFKLSTPRESGSDMSSFMKAMAQLPIVLKQLGYDSLLPGQDRVIYNLLMQKDTFCVLPTGGGKSLCYIVPTVCLQWKCLIFSPLVSLMQDQVEALWKYRLQAAQLSSGQETAENRMALMSWENGDLQFLLVAPERMDNKNFREIMQRVKPNLVVVDESHAASRWVSSFRPSYARIRDLIDAVNPNTVLSMTATATPDIEKDIRTLLRIQNAHRIVYFPKRKNLILSSKPYISDYDLLHKINDIDGPVIVYSLTQKRCEELYALLGKEIEGGALVYHGGLASSERTSNQLLFMQNEIRVMFATNAFGMGINKRDIRGIIHRDMTRSVEDYTQEIGRAGRDGKKSSCILYTNEDAERTIRWFIDTEFPEYHLVNQVFAFIQRMQNEENILRMTIEDIASNLHINSKVVGSVMGILTRFKVLDRTKVPDLPVRVQFIRSHLESKFQMYLDTIARIGVMNDEGFYEFKQELLVSQTKTPIKKLQDNLRLLHTNGYIKLILPFRGSTTTVIGDITLVDFPEIVQRRKDALDKLNRMFDYVETDDHDKHDFLIDYFKAAK